MHIPPEALSEFAVDVLPRLRRTVAVDMVEGLFAEPDIRGPLPVLTVGESPAFVQQGGGVALVRVENRLVFDVNLGAITRSGLRVSPQMLRLAREVVGAPR